MKPELEVTPNKEQPKFTRGPWSVGRKAKRRSAAHVWVKTRSGEIVADVRTVAPFAVNTDRGSETTEANARLIAAAPALYKSLREILDGPARAVPAGRFGVWDRARAALALVDGPQKETSDG